MVKLDEARNQILATLQVLPGESIPLGEAHGRVLAEQIISPVDLPSFDNSAMDGYAVQSKNLISASQSAPVSLRMVGTVAAGDCYSGKLNSGECVRIFTGSPLPSGSDAVAMQEDARNDSQNKNHILFLDSVKPWENIRFHGEDVKTGSVLAEPGTRLTPGYLSLLGAVGLQKVSVTRQPIVGLLATGSELLENHQLLQPGKIYESNRIALAALARKAGAIPQVFPLVPDTLQDTKSALKKAFEQCDVVVTSGGVSVGEFDFIKEAFQEIGGHLELWKISIKPGKPFVFGQWNGKTLFGLPGNPVSALVTFVVLVGPALAHMQGNQDTTWKRFPGTLITPLENPGDRPHFVRVKVDSKGDVRMAGIQASHILSGFAQANGLLEIPPGTRWEKGVAVSVLRMD